MEGVDETVVVEESGSGRRLDVFLAERYVDRLSRSRIKKMIEGGDVKVTGHIVSPHYPIKTGDVIEISWPEFRPPETRAENIPLNVVHEDEDLIVVNKPAGMVVHPAHGNLEHTLVNALLYYIRELSEFHDPVRPGIVHRLDKDTSGIMVVAKNEFAHAFLAKQFRQHTIERVYYGIVRGVVQHDEGTCEEPVGRAFLNRKKVVIKPSGGKEAFTFFRVLKRFAKTTLLEIRPGTGRTHQIRVHMAHLGHPVLGDALYGYPDVLLSRHALHAKSLGLRHPKSKEKLSFDSELPEDMAGVLRRLESGV